MILDDDHLFTLNELVRLQCTGKDQSHTIAYQKIKLFHAGFNIYF